LPSQLSSLAAKSHTSSDFNKASIGSSQKSEEFLKLTSKPFTTKAKKQMLQSELQSTQLES
jgi:hypothetical protein